MNDAELLQEFAKTRSDSAFYALVTKHLPLVFGTARRVTHNPALAEDITQAVFILLARKAAQLSSETVLSGWLFRTTRFVSLRALRSELRRHQREETATVMYLEITSEPPQSQIAARLDEALASLSEKDRHAVLLRFFEGRRPAEVGTALGLSEEGAKKRITRAIEKLRQILGRRGIEISAATLTAALLAEANAGIPADLPKRIASSTLTHLALGAGTAGTAGLTAEILRAIAWTTKLKWAAAVILTSVALLFFTRQAALRMETTGIARSDVTRTTSNSAQPAAVTTGLVAHPKFIEINGESVRLKNVRITVLDAESSSPIAEAEARHYLTMGPESASKLRTGLDGVAEFQIPEDLPAGGRELKQFQMFVHAAGYAPRDIMWLCSTGNVLRTVGPEYTVKLLRGGTIGGTVVSDRGEPLPDVQLHVVGNNYHGYSYSLDSEGHLVSPPEIRVEDFASFATSSGHEQGLPTTDSAGHFRLDQFPNDLNAITLELITPSGAHHRFATAEGKRLTGDKLPIVSMGELRAETARIILERGFDIAGTVVDPDGRPVPGALVNEAIRNEILSRNQTDAQGAFRLPNRKPREVLLGASASGYGSVSALVTVSAELAPVRLQLRPELPLRGRVVDPAGAPIANALVQLAGNNDELPFEWRTATDSDGKFVWAGAPTNHLILLVSADGFGARIVPLRASLAEQTVTLAPGTLEKLRLTGRVSDVDSGQAIPLFTVQIGTMSGNVVPDYIRHTAEGRHGEFEVELNLAETAIESHSMLALVVEAEGYEQLITEPFFVLEGDKQFDLMLRRGGTTQGVVLAPDGSPAAGCALTVAHPGDTVISTRPGELSRGRRVGPSDDTGRFRFRTPAKSEALIAFHHSGWAIEPLTSETTNLTVQLKPWASITVEPDESHPFREGDRIALNSLSISPPGVLQLMLKDAPNSGGTVSFDRVPAGEFILRVVPANSAMYGQDFIYTRCTNVLTEAGEQTTVQLGNSGDVSVRLKLVSQSGDVTSTRVVLKRDVPLPTDRFEYYASMASLRKAALLRESDPNLIALKRQQQSFFGDLAPDGQVTFQNVAPGRYILEARQFRITTNRFHAPEVAVVAELHESLEITSISESLDLGARKIEPVN